MEGDDLLCLMINTNTTINISSTPIPVISPTLIPAMREIDDGELEVSTGLLLPIEIVSFRFGTGQLYR